MGVSGAARLPLLPDVVSGRVRDLGSRASLPRGAGHHGSTLPGPGGVAAGRTVRRARRVRRRVAVYASAAALVLAISVPTWRIAVRPAMVPSAPAASRVEPSTGEAATDFFPLIYGSVPISDGQIVRMEVPRTALASFGLASIDALEGSSPATVLADVVVGVDGLARAVRFVRPVTN